MCLVNDDGKFLIFQSSHRADDVRKLLDGGGDDLGVAFKRGGEVGGRTLLVHDTDQPCLVFHAENGGLQLSVHHHSVRDDDHIVKYDIVVVIVERRKPMRKPRNGISLAGACAVLNEVVLRGVIDAHIREQFSDDIELMIARKYDILFLALFARDLIALRVPLYEHEAGDKLRQRILGEDVLPHITYAVFVLENGVALAGFHAAPFAHVEGKEISAFSGKARGHIHLVEIHCKVDKTPRLETEKPRIRVARFAVLKYGVVIGLPCKVALQLEGHERKPVDEHHEVHPLVIRRPHFFHDGENVFLIERDKLAVQPGRRLPEKEIQLVVCDFHPVLQRIDEAAAVFCQLGVDGSDHGVLRLVPKHLAERRHSLGLRLVQKLEEHLTIHGELGVKAKILPLHISVLAHQPLDYVPLIFLFRQNVVHCFVSFDCELIIFCITGDNVRKTFHHFKFYEIKRYTAVFLCFDSAFIHFFKISVIIRSCSHFHERKNHIIFILI